MCSRKIAFIAPIIATLSAVFASESARGDDWPQWNGPTRDGVVGESGIVSVIPQEGLPLLWRAPVGLGYSGPVVVDGRCYVCDYQKRSGEVINNAGKRDTLQGNERVVCLDAKTGDSLWVYEYDRPYAVSYGAGPRATPVVHQGRLYLLGSEGDLTCLDAKTGEKLWHRQFTDEFGAKTPLWGHAASPLIHRDTVICMVGGEGSLVVAFDRDTGTEKWRSLTSAETGYCPPTLVAHAGIEQLLIWDPERIHGLDPKSGKPYWGHELKPDYGMSILPPVVENGWVFAGGEGRVSAMLKLDDAKPDAEVVWRGSPKTGLYLATSAAIFDDGFLYGADISTGALICARASDGERMWQSALPTTGSKRGRGAAHASAFLLRVGESYLILSETGDFISARLTPEGYEETGRFHAIDPTGKTMGRDYVWTYPAIANGRLYLRNDKEVVCYDVSASSVSGRK